ncbi:MAG TPA: peptidylprolyl isomerase [Bryobacteraceae bacterium]|nr:peptidylprolyl isomerase [Bryobacteraceae bacterium]
MTIGSETMTDKEFQNIIDALPENVRAQATGPMKRQFAEQIVRMKLLAQEARARGLDKDPSFRARMSFQEENMLAAALYTDLQQKLTPDEAALRKYLADNKTEFESVNARHILIRFKGSPVQLKEGQKDLTEEEALAKAQELKKRLDAGEDFAKLAKENSDDAGSGANGGDLGSFKKGQMVPEFEKAAFQQPVGTVGEPLKTQFGYHIVKVEKRGEADFAALKPELERRIKPEAARQAIEDMRTKASVTLDEGYFGPEPSKNGAPGAAAPAGTTTPPAPK